MCDVWTNLAHLALRYGRQEVYDGSHSLFIKCMNLKVKAALFPFLKSFMYSEMCSLLGYDNIIMVQTTWSKVCISVDIYLTDTIINKTKT